MAFTMLRSALTVRPHLMAGDLSVLDLKHQKRRTPPKMSRDKHPVV